MPKSYVPPIMEDDNTLWKYLLTAGERVPGKRKRVIIHWCRRQVHHQDVTTRACEFRMRQSLQMPLRTAGFVPRSQPRESTKICNIGCERNRRVNNYKSSDAEAWSTWKLESSHDVDENVIRELVFKNKFPAN